MDTPELKLITAEDASAPAPRSRAAPALGLALCAFAVVATLFGADAARRDVDARVAAEAALLLALERGNDDDEVRAALVDLRRRLGRRPLDARTRVAYASLLLGLSSSREDVELAAFHARRSAELSPVTVSVIRSAALVLAHTGDVDQSLGMVRRMFGYDPARAARLLAQIESRVLGIGATDGIPESPEAWMAWVLQLRQDRRMDEEQHWLRKVHARWPEHLPALEQLAARAFMREDWPTLETLFPDDLVLPDEPEAARLLLWRARFLVQREQRERALADARRALQLAPASSWVSMLAGDLYESLDDHSGARHQWNRALYLLPSDQTQNRRGLLARLARLEDEHGRPAAALRLWQALLELDPGNAEARRRMDDLTGFRR